MQPTKQTSIKSGFLTSEFFATAASGITGVLIMLGYLTPQQADEFTTAVVAVIGGLTTIVATVVYIVGRVQLKQTQLQSGSQSDGLLEGIPDAPIDGQTVE